jgi:hypothetical protein
VDNPGHCEDLPPGQAVQVEVTFTRTAHGPFEGRLVVRSDDPSLPRFALILMGSGDIGCHGSADADCDGAISPDELSANLERWRNGEVTSPEALEAIARFRAQ